MLYSTETKYSYKTILFQLPPPLKEILGLSDVWYLDVYCTFKQGFFYKKFSISFIIHHVWRDGSFINPILISIDFVILFPSFSLYLIISLRSYIKHSRECFIRYLNTSKTVKNNSAAPCVFNPSLGVWKS